MKIAQVPGDEIPFSPKLPFSPYSVVTISYLLTEELVKRGHEVTAFVPSDSKTSAKVPPELLPADDPRFKKYTFRKRYGLFKQYCQNIISKSEQFDIIHVHDIYLGTFKLLKNVKTPVIGTFHNPRFYKKDKKYFSKTMFVAISQSQINNNPGFNFIGKVHNGILVEKFPFNDKPKNYLFWIGRISPEKGALAAIKVANRAKMKLIMAGPIPPYHKKYIKKFLREVKKSKYVKFIGKISNFKEKVNYFKNAVALLFPAKWEEPFGLVMVEAMACGTPVVAFSRGAVPEIIKDGKTGFLVKTIPQMAKAIERIPEISRKDCREWVEKKFSVEKMTDGYEKIYRKIIKKYKNN